ncbi:MAG TPA: hypothetical protein VL251_05980 [Thermomonas sp.]|nr:hypothetical protein [Thermomonas sp.]
MLTQLLLAAALAVQPVSTPPPVVSIPASMPPPPAQVMAIPEELRAAFRREVVDATRFPEARLEKLVAFVFGPDKLGVEYKAEATQSVADSFRSRKVNCLSSTLLVVALAREAGLKAEAQEIDQVLAWGSTGELVIQSKHANAIIQVSSKRRFVVDVDSSDVEATAALNPIGDEKLLALFYGNRAMELMADGQAEAARPWLEEALRHAPGDPGLLNNAGVLSLRLGLPEDAERRFLAAYEADPAQPSVLSNLIALYQRRGDLARASLWQARSNQVLRHDPYYQYKLGRERERAGDAPAAVRFYRRAISLHRGEHLFHFALARTYLGLGNVRKADRELSIAHELSDGPLRQRYQDKLAALRQMRR